MSGRQKGRGRGRLIRQKGADGRHVYLGDWIGADGKRHRRSLSSDKLVAERMLAKLIRERDLAASGLIVEEGMERRLVDLTTAYVADLRAIRTESYADRVEADLRHLSDYLGNVKIREVVPERMLERRRKRITEGASHATINLEVGSLRGCFNWAIRSGLLGVNPLAHVKPLSLTEADQARPRRALSEEEVSAFLRAAIDLDVERHEYVLALRTIASKQRGAAYAAQDRLPPIPQAVLWQTILATGMRWGETAALTWGDFDPDRRSMLIRAATTKGKRSRMVPVPSYLIVELATLRSAHERRLARAPWPADFIFLTPFGKPWTDTGCHYRLDLFNATLARAEIEKVDELGRSVDVHALRRTANTRLLRHGVPIMTAATILGHQDPKITAKHYTELHLADTLAAVASVPPAAASEPSNTGKVAVEAGSILAIRRGGGGSRNNQLPRNVCARHDLNEMGAPGVEPGTYGLKIRCSTD